MGIAAFKAAIQNKSQATKKDYIYALNSFLESQKSKSGDFLLLSRQEAEEKVSNYLQTKSYNDANKAVSALKLFCAANRYLIDWDYVRLYMPQKQPVQSFRLITQEEIKKQLALAHQREKTAIMIMLTSGLRIGALSGLRIERDFENVKDTYAITAYNGEPGQYKTFVTPQAAEEIKKTVGRRKGGYLFVSHLDGESKVTVHSLYVSITKVQQRAGLSGDLQPNHAFRKYFRTQLFNAGILDENAEKLLGHIPELVKTYALPSADELYKRTEYEKAIPYLMI